MPLPQPQPGASSGSNLPTVPDLSDFLQPVRGLKLKLNCLLFPPSAFVNCFRCAVPELDGHRLSHSQLLFTLFIMPFSVRTTEKPRSNTAGIGDPLGGRIPGHSARRCSSKRA